MWVRATSGHCGQHLVTATPKSRSTPGEITRFGNTPGGMQIAFDLARHEQDRGVTVLSLGHELGVGDDDA